MKTPEEIKKGLECCSVPDYIDHLCEQCPYVYDGCYKQMLQVDALAYIQQLEQIASHWQSSMGQVQKAFQDNGFQTLEELLQAFSQVKRERDAAVSEIPHHCWNCAYHRDDPIEETDDYGRTIHIYCDADCCFPDENSSWEWRGVQEPPKQEGVNDV